MKKLILLVLCLVSYGLHAQEFHFIPKVGMNISSMTNAEGTDPRIGLNIGVNGEMVLSERFSFEPGVYYSMQGLKVTGGSLKNDYLNVPLLGKFYAYKGLNFFAGPQVGFLVSSKAHGKAEGISADVDVKDLFKTVDLALVFGVGYQTDLGLNFSFNYNLGLVNTIDNGHATIAGQSIDIDGGSSKNSVFQFNVGWRF